jgi:hypothetical protein
MATLEERVMWALHVDRSGDSPRKEWAEMPPAERAVLREQAEVIIGIVERHGAASEVERLREALRKAGSELEAENDRGAKHIIQDALNGKESP